LVIFAGLRYRVGWDWLGYEKYFFEILGFPELLDNGWPSTELKVEPLFALLAVIIKSFTDNFILFFLSIAIISLLPVFFVIKNISGRSAIVWVAYFGFAFLMGQMNIMRQVLASSFVLLSLLMVVKDRRIWAATLIIVAAGFQVSVLLFSPLLFLYKIRPSVLVSIIVIILGVVLCMTGFDLAEFLFTAGRFFSPEWIGSKLSFSNNLKQNQLSFGAIALLAIHLALLFSFYFLSDPVEKNDHYIKMAIWLTLILVVAHLYLHAYPVFWNRLMLVALPWQLAVFFRMKKISSLPPIQSIVIVTFIFVISSGALVHALRQPGSLAIVPYHSALQVWMFSDEGTGEDRIRRANDGI